MEYKRGYFVFNTYKDGSETIIGAFVNPFGALTEARKKLKQENLKSSEVKDKAFIVTSDGNVFISNIENLKIIPKISDTIVYDTNKIECFNSMYEEHQFRNPIDETIQKSKNVVEVKKGWFASVSGGAFGDNEIHGVFESEKDANDYWEIVGEMNHFCSFEQEYVIFNDKIHLMSVIDESVSKNELNNVVTHRY